MLLAHVLCALVGASVATRGLRVSLFAAVCARSVWGRTPHQCPYLPSDCRSLLLLVAIPLAWLPCTVVACLAIANVVKSSLGPVGLDKMLVRCVARSTGLPLHQLASPHSCCCRWTILEISLSPTMVPPS